MLWGQNIHRVLIGTSYNIFVLFHSPFLQKDSGLKRVTYTIVSVAAHCHTVVVMYFKQIHILVETLYAGSQDYIYPRSMACQRGAGGGL